MIDKDFTIKHDEVIKYNARYSNASNQQYKLTSHLQAATVSPGIQLHKGSHGSDLKYIHLPTFIATSGTQT